MDQRKSVYPVAIAIGASKNKIITDQRKSVYPVAIAIGASKNKIITDQRKSALSASTYLFIVDH